MPISMILTLAGPLVVKVLSSLWDRLWSHGVSTLQGTAAGLGVLTLLSAMGCDLTLANQAVIGAIAAGPGLIGTDPGKISDSLLTSAMARIEQEKRSRAVMQAAQAEQDKAKA